MVVGANDDLPRNNLLLEVTFQAKILIAGDQHPLIHAAVRIVASGATFTQSLVVKYEWPALRGMTLETGLIWRPERSAATFHCGAFVRIVTIGTANFSIFQRMVGGHAELPALVEMALKTGFRRFVRIDDGAVRAAGFVVEAAGAVARFAADVLGIVPQGLQSRVRRGMEITHNVGVALVAGGRAGKRGAGNLRRRENGAGDGAAGNDHHRHKQRTGNETHPAAMHPHPGFAVPQKFTAGSVLVHGLAGYSCWYTFALSLILFQQKIILNIRIQFALILIINYT